MRVAHLADLHLSHAQYQRFTPTGINVREADVAATFKRAIDKVIELAPDVIVVAGDLFDMPKPSNASVIFAFQQWQRVVQKLPRTKIVHCLGNHDAARTTAAGSILPLFASLGIRVVDRAAERICYPDLDLFVLALPDVPGVVRPAFTPDPAAKYSLAVIHGEVEGMPRRCRPPRDSRTGVIPTASIGLDAWSYVACGHYHVHQLLAPNMAYSGSLDFVSSDPWSEIGTPKGFVVRDLDTGSHEFIEIPTSRRYIDLPRIDALGMTAEQLNDAIAEATSVDLKDAVVRLVVVNTTKPLERAIDLRVKKNAQRGTLNFKLDLRKIDIERRAPIAATYAELRQRSLPEILAERMGRRAVPSDVDPVELTKRGLGYLEQATEVTAEKSVNPDRTIAHEAA